MVHTLEPSETVIRSEVYKNRRRKPDSNYSWNLIRSIWEASKSSPANRDRKKQIIHERFYDKESRAVVEKTAMDVSSGAVGGYLVPPGYSDVLFEALVEYSIIRDRAIVIPIETQSTYFPKPNAEQATAKSGVSPFFGNIQFTWGEGGHVTIPENIEPAIDQLNLRANDLIGQCVVSNQFMSDIGDAGEEVLIKLFGRAAAWYEEYAFFQGIGAGNFSPLGMLNSPACQNNLIQRAGAGAVVQSDIANMVTAMIPMGWSTAIWVCSPTTLQKIIQISGYISNQSAAMNENGCAGSLVGRPLFVTEKLPAVGSIGDLMFIDPSCYVIGDRQDTIIDVSPHPLFNIAQSVIRVWRRLDGKPLLSNYVTLADGTTKASPFVALTK
jgi:HK97 family phage major capsid protein